MFSDEIATLLTQTNQQPLLSGLGEPGGEARYGQGKILSWDPTSFENQIAYRGGVLSNLPVLSGPDALTYRRDDVVSIMSFSPNRGATVYWIMGRVIIPGPGRGAEAIEWMTGELGRRISASVFADRVYFDEVFTSESGAPIAPTFADLATFGPQVTDVEVTEAGKIIVFLGCGFSMPAAGQASGAMSFELDGPSVGVPQYARSVQLGTNGPNAPLLFASYTRHETLDGLQPGQYTVTAKYSSGNTNGPDVVFTNRELMVIAF